jgi:hypothetical protein
MTTTETPVRRWRRKAPDRDGWWRFREDGFFEQRILVRDGCVADDQEWEDAMDRPPSEVTCENYWEGNDVVEMTSGPLTTGVWMFEQEAQCG